MALNALLQIYYIMTLKIVNKWFSTRILYTVYIHANNLMQHLPAHDGKEWTIGMLQSFSKVRQLFLQEETRSSLRQLAAHH